MTKLLTQIGSCIARSHHLAYLVIPSSDLMVCYPQLVRITAEDLEETSSLELGETWRLLLLCVSAQENDIYLIGTQLVYPDILLKQDKIMSCSTPNFCSVSC